MFFLFVLAKIHRNNIYLKQFFSMAPTPTLVALLGSSVLKDLTSGNSMQVSNMQSYSCNRKEPGLREGFKPTLLKKSMGEQWRVKSGPCDPRWHSSDLLFRIRKECLGRRRRSTGSYRDKYIMKTKISSLIGFLVCMWHLKEFA